MKVVLAYFLLISGLALAQTKPTSQAEPKSVTVPATIDHNRVIVDADVLLPDNTWHSVHAWVDNGNPELEMSRKVSTMLALPVTCGDQECSAPPPRQIAVGGMLLNLTGLKSAKLPLKPVSASHILAAGMDVDINLPASVLRQYDVLINFPEHKFTLGVPGTIRFAGSSSRVQVNAANGLIEVPSQIEKKKMNLALDLGSCISFLSEDLFDSLAKAHPDWPHMTGAVGSANMWGGDAETSWKVMRVARLQYGPLFLTDVAEVALSKNVMDFLEKRAAMPTSGIVGSNVLLNYRVGLDYAHSMVYFDIGRLFNFPDFDVIGLVLRPEDDGRFRILGIADPDAKPSLPSGPDGVQPGDYLIAVNGIPVRGVTMGQVWSMLGGTPGQERRLTIERGGKTSTVIANVQHFLGAVESDEKKK